MRVIARIPDASRPAAPRGPGQGLGAPEAADAADPAPRPRRRGLVARLDDVWPTWPVAALAMIAVMAWMLASWNDHARLHRQRGQERMARKPSAAPTEPAAAAAPAGALVR